MPATEKTANDTKLLNLVFGVMAIVMFFATLWLLAADHAREWKSYQRKFQEIENWTLVSRDNEQQTENYTLTENALQAAVDRAVLTPPTQADIDAFVAQTASYDGVAKVDAQVAALKAVYASLAGSLQGIDLPKEDTAQLHKHAQEVAPLRENLFVEMADVIAAVKFVEDGKATDRKFRRADLDATKSKYDLAVRDSLPLQEKNRLRDAVALVEVDVAGLTKAFEAANEHRKSLEKNKKEMQENEATALKQLAVFQSTRAQLQSSLAEKTAFGRGLLELPIIDAFGRPLRIDQVWLPNLTLNNNFRDVARFDRCVTCHQGIDNTSPGSAVEPGYAQHQPMIALALETPSSPPAGDQSGDQQTTQVLYGFQLSEHGLIQPSDVLVEFVWPRSVAAVAGLEPGDVITHIRVGGRNEKLKGNADALRYLTKQVSWGQPIELTVRRGYPQPYSSHPRLDLFVGSMSPHTKQEMGCTICHEGQGSATDFKWASHTPNDPREAERWREEYGWFDNHHWVLPMQPHRFVESSCLKCHHEVAELEPSERYPQPPAPKLMEGYRLVKYYGCFGCHEVNGYDGPDHRVGPDLRSEPNYFAAAQQVAYLLDELSPAKKDAIDAAAVKFGDTAQLTMPSIRKLAEDVSYHPEDAMKRRELLGILEKESGRQYAAEELLEDPRLTALDAREWARDLRDDPFDSATREKLISWIEEDRQKTNPELSVNSHNLIASLKQPSLVPTEVMPMIALLKDVEAPGTMRRVGPSLRYVRSKLGSKTLAAWIKRPQDIRPTSKMPAFFGLHDHLKDDPEIVADTVAMEEIEIRAISHYLYERSQPFAYAPADKSVTESPSAERGKVQFEIRGCLACHSHDGTPAGEAMQGPNLSNLAKKINTEKGKEWLRSWLLNPSRYHRRTVMPVMYLDPEPLQDETGSPQMGANGAPRMTDPSADMAAYLLGTDWEATADTLPSLSGPQTKVLDKLVLDYLKGAFAEKRAEAYLKDGIPERLSGALKGAEVELLGSADESHRLMYVGRRTISKYGCAGCHDIPGMEAEKPIGAALAEWGRKDPSKIAFEHIVHYVEKKHAEGDASAGHAHGEDGEDSEDGEEDHSQKDESHDGDSYGINVSELPPDEGYYTSALMSHSREGFLRQKLLEPRSYDYEKVKNKGYNDRLRMPLFPWAAGVMETDVKRKKRDEEIEAIMTFVLGLVAEPPASEYVYQPDTRREAIVQGEKVLAKFNCAGCHTLELGRWDLAYRPGDFGGSDQAPIYPFLKPSYSTEEVQDSRNVDWQGMLHSSLRGMERVDADGYPEQMVYDPEEEDYLSLEEYRDAYESDPPPGSQGYSVELWEPTFLDGHPYVVKDPLRTIPEQMVTHHYPPRGGDFARLLLPIAVELVRQTEPTADGTAAMAWVPPPLVGQGNKTQEAWLSEFLLNPYPIRPGVLLRMPKFNLSRADAESLVQYFAARDNADYPQQFVASRNRADLEQAAFSYQQRLLADGESGGRLDDALKIVLNKAGCIACHSVNDQRPEGGDRGNGPNLADVHQRLQSSYMKRWIAKPSWILPYTKMQELLPYKPDDPPAYGGFELPVLNAQGQPVVAADGKPQLIELYHGTGAEQLQAVVDLLANFGSYVESKTSIQQRAEQLEQQLGGGATNQPQTPQTPQTAERR